MAYPAYWHNACFNMWYRYRENYDDTDRFSCAPPDSNAYSLGVPEGDLALDPIWVSYGFNHSTHYSQSSLIKDENDNFYFATTIRHDGGYAIVIEKFNEDEEIDLDFIIPFSHTPSAFDNIYLRKKSETLFDVVIFDLDCYNLKHYIVNIGNLTCVQCGSYSYTEYEYGSLMNSVLVGGKAISAFASISAGKVYTIVYDLDSCSTSVSTIFDLSTRGIEGYERMARGFTAKAIPSGNSLAVIILEYHTSDTVICPYLGVDWEWPLESKAYWIVFQFDASGYSSSETCFDTAWGCQAAHSQPQIRDYCYDPGSNTVYFWAGINRDWSSTECRPWLVTVPPSAEFNGGIIGLASCTGTSCGFYAEWHTADYGGEIPPDYVEDSIAVPAREQPLTYSHINGEKCIYNWATQEIHLQNDPRFDWRSFSNPDGYNRFAANGQRNDTGPALFSNTSYSPTGDAYVSFAHYHINFFGLSGETHATLHLRSGLIENISGFMGKWPITVEEGQAMIWGSPLIDSDKGVFVQTVELDTSGSIAGNPGIALGLGEPEGGDRSAWNIFEYPTIHANDIYLDHHRYHSPIPDDIGQSPIWNGTKWLTGYVMTSGEGEYGWEDHWHLEEDVTDLLHNAEQIHGITVIDDPLASEYLMYSEMQSGYISSPLVSEKDILGTKQFGVSSSGSLSTSGSIPIRLLSPWDGIIQKVYLSVGDPPGEQPIIVDVNRNGTTIFTDQDNRPTILAGECTGLTENIDINSVAINDVFTVDLDQIGTSGSSGSNLAIAIVVNT